MSNTNHHHIRVTVDNLGDPVAVISEIVTIKALPLDDDLLAELCREINRKWEDHGNRIAKIELDGVEYRVWGANLESLSDDIHRVA